MTVVSAIAAIGKNRELGKENKLLWQIPDDLKRFKELTAGHPVIMGRKTFESIIGYLGKPLSNRLNIVVTRNPDEYLNKESTVKIYFSDPVWAKDVAAVSSIDEAIKTAKSTESDEVFIIGGAQIYEAALPFTDKLYLTVIDDEKSADSFFPEYEHLFTIQTEEAHEWNGLKYTWINLERAR